MRIGNKEYKLGDRTYIMGNINVTPDSFSDGGKFNEIEKKAKYKQRNWWKTVLI